MTILYIKRMVGGPENLGGAVEVFFNHEERMDFSFSNLSFQPFLYYPKYSYFNLVYMAPRGGGVKLFPHCQPNFHAPLAILNGCSLSE